MNLFNQISITNSKLSSLINATNTYKDTGLMFLGEGADNNLVIIDVINFGFLCIFPVLSNFFKVNVASLISYFFLILFFVSLIFTLISCFKLCLNKSKILPLIILVLIIYFFIFKFILITNAEYFIYFFWGMLPITYYFIDRFDSKTQTIYVYILSFFNNNLRFFIILLLFKLFSFLLFRNLF